MQWCVFSLDCADAEPPSLKGVDFYVDPEATPPVRTLRSQSLHTSSGTQINYLLSYFATDVCLTLCQIFVLIFFYSSKETDKALRKCMSPITCGCGVAQENVLGPLNFLLVFRLVCSTFGWSNLFLCALNSDMSDYYNRLFEVSSCVGIFVLIFMYGVSTVLTDLY